MEEEIVQKLIYALVIGIILLVNFLARKKKQQATQSTQVPKVEKREETPAYSQPTPPIEYKTVTRPTLTPNFFPPIEANKERRTTLETIPDNTFSYDSLVEDENADLEEIPADAEELINHRAFKDNKRISKQEVIKPKVQINLQGEEARKAVIYSEIFKPKYL